MLIVLFSEKGYKPSSEKCYNYGGRTVARIKFFSDAKIAIYIYGEMNEKHHEKHVLVMKADEKCNYDFKVLL